jgi:hypothetical protein
VAAAQEVTLGRVAGAAMAASLARAASASRLGVRICRCPRGHRARCPTVTGPQVLHSLGRRLLRGSRGDCGPASMVAMSGGTPIPEQIDAIVAEPGGWRSAMLAHLRDVIRMADSSVVEDVKWKKPSRPMGVPVWCRDGNLCIGEALKNAVRLTFPKGAQIKDRKHLFNARLDSNSVRAIDFHEGDRVDEAALKALIVQAVRLNTSRVMTK